MNKVKWSNVDEPFSGSFPNEEHLPDRVHLHDDGPLPRALLGSLKVRNVS